MSSAFGNKQRLHHAHGFAAVEGGGHVRFLVRPPVSQNENISCSYGKHTSRRPRRRPLAAAASLPRSPIRRYPRCVCARLSEIALRPPFTSIAEPLLPHRLADQAGQ